MSNISTTNTPRTVTLDAADGRLEQELLRVLAESDDADDAKLGRAGQAAFDAARERGEGISSALGLAKLAMAQIRRGAA